MSKQIFVVDACLVLSLLFSGCRISSEAPAITISPNPLDPFSSNVTFTPMHTPASFPIPPYATQTLTLGLTQIPGSTEVPLATTEMFPSQISYPTLIPTLEFMSIPDLLERSLSIDDQKSINGHLLKRISGWDYGFEGYEWLDGNHILIHSIVGQEDTPNFGRLVETYPAVLNLISEKVWVLPANGTTRWGVTKGDLPRWSAKLGSMITSEMNSTDHFVAVYDPVGNLRSRYPDELLGVSPSGTKILVSDHHWIDLSTEKMVVFAWSQDLNQETFYFPAPIWSADETRVYLCCYRYGDAKAGTIDEMSASEFSVNGKKVDQTLFHSGGEWVLNDQYFLVQWDQFYDTNPGFIPLFDPATNTYRNLNVLAGIPSEYMGIPSCLQTSPSPDGQYVWVECYDGDYLVNLMTYESQSYPDLIDVDISWSADSKFAWLDDLTTDGDPSRILSVSNKELMSFPINPSVAVWHPTKPILASLSEDQRNLLLINAENGSIQEAGLTADFKKIIWSPTGNQIALLAADGSLWRIDYPNLQSLEQLTQPKPDVKDVAWSLDGSSLTFISNMEMYILEDLAKP